MGKLLERPNSYRIPTTRFILPRIYTYSIKNNYFQGVLNNIGGLILIKICKYCGYPILNPKHGNQIYHHEPHNGNTESCVNLAHKDNVRDNVREYRKTYGRRNENIIGSRNANLGASALTDFDKEYTQVHKEKMRLVGS